MKLEEKIQDVEDEKYNGSSMGEDQNVRIRGFF